MPISTVRGTVFGTRTEYLNKLLHDVFLCTNECGKTLLCFVNPQSCLYKQRVCITSSFTVKKEILHMYAHRQTLLRIMHFFSCISCLRACTCTLFVCKMSDLFLIFSSSAILPHCSLLLPPCSGEVH